MTNCKWCGKTLTKSNQATYKVEWFNDKLLYCRQCVEAQRAKMIVPKMSNEQKEKAIKKATKKLKRIGATPEEIQEGLKEAGLK